MKTTITFQMILLYNFTHTQRILITGAFILFYSTIVLGQDIPMAKAARMMTSSRIEVSGASTYDCMWLITNPTCSSAYNNGWDGTKILGPLCNLQIYSKENDGKIYQVNTTNDVNGMQIWMRTAADSVYTIKFNNEYLSLSYSSLYLFDIDNKTITDVTTTGATYTFKAKSNDADRCRFVVFTSMTSYYIAISLATNVCNTIKSDIQLITNDNAMRINNMTDNKLDIQLLSMTGQVVGSFTASEQETKTIQTSVPSGLYIARVMTDGKLVKTEKMILK